MLNSMVIKKLHTALTLLLLIIIGCLIINNGNSQDSDALKRSQKINQSTWLYMTEYDSGGATVPALYRYYLTSEIVGNDQQVLKKLNTLEPLIEGSGSIHSLSLTADGKVTFGWSGKIFSVSSEITKANFEIEN